MKTLKVALCLPWYNGADPDCNGAFLMFQHYLGRVQERLHTLNRMPGPMRPLGPLDPWDLTAEIPPKFIGTDIEFMVCSIIGYSLPGIARERAIDAALAQGADYILFWDDDMIFTPSVFFQLLAHEKPVVAALAFTARLPIIPVIYKFEESPRGVTSSAILDYKRNALQKVDAVGFGVVMIQASVFRKIPKPWFSNPGAGEDIQFCGMCRKYGVPVFVDTAAKTAHKPRHSPEWHSEDMYLLSRDPEVIEAEKALAELKAARLVELQKKETA